MQSKNILWDNILAEMIQDVKNKNFYILTNAAHKS